MPTETVTATTTAITATDATITAAAILNLL
jgi:hypothetical protein